MVGPCGSKSFKLRGRRPVQQIQANEHAQKQQFYRTDPLSHRARQIVTWDSSEVQAHLKNVQQIQSTTGAFAAILRDGFLVTWNAWNNEIWGGDSSKVQRHVPNL